MKRNARQLSRIYENLSREAQTSLFDFAEFLSLKAEPLSERITSPLDTPRPQEETVVGAIKRLKKTYPMIESSKVFSAASGLMTEHMVNGRDAVEVINDMQLLFEDSYQEFLKDVGSD